MERKRALVTGGCGFVGSNLVHRLIYEGWKVDIVDDMSNGHLDFLDGLDIRVVLADTLHLYENQAETDRSKTRTLVVQGDFVHESLLNRIRSGVYNVVFHLAANPRVEYSVEKPTATAETNLFKTIALFTSAVGNVDRLVFSSSSAVYGEQKSLPTGERSPKNPSSPYGLQKLQCEQHASMFSKLYNLDIVCLRYFNVYGPRQMGNSPYSTAVSAWSNKVYSNERLRSDGDGEQTRDLVFVDDVAEANILAANNNRKFTGDCFNIASGMSYSNNQVLDMFRARFGDIKVNKAPWRSGDVMHTKASVETAEFTLGFKAKTSLNEGLRQTWHWWNFNSQVVNED
jgi:UDP-glucose 4-epimerase